jgi:ABC-type polysaccharide/polyol phosphate export permease
MIRLLRNVIEYRHAFKNQFVVNIKTTVAATKIGPLWWVIDPLILMCIYYFVVKIVFGRGGPNFHLFALCGIVTWQSFSRSITMCTKSITGNSSLIKQTALPMQLYVLIPPVVQSFFYLIGLIIIAAWNNNMAGLHSFSLLLLILLMIFIPFGLGLFLSILEVHLPDTGKLIPLILRIGFYFSPVLYSAERVYRSQHVPDFIKAIYSYNPMVYVISAVRDVLLNGKLFELRGYAILLFITIVIVQIGLIFFHRFSPSVPKSL